jgi:hypothetical protein
VVKNDQQFRDIFSSYQHTKFLIFIVPWVLTWFAHNFDSVKIICRIWDYILCTGPHGVLYLTCGIILGTKEDLLKECQEFDVSCSTNIGTDNPNILSRSGQTIDN